MAAHRAFYVTQGSLTVWQKGRHGLVQEIIFADNDEGLRQFDAYLGEHGDQTSFLVVDVIEEEFAPDTIPKLGLRDRGSLMQRRLQRKFPRSPYRLPVYQGSKAGSPDEALVVHSAISNHELLDPWLQMAHQHEVPLSGIFSVPLMAPAFVKEFHKASGPALLITQHQQYKLRQVFLQDGNVQSARLSQSPALADDDYGSFVITEIHRSRQYLERTRLLSNLEQLDVYIVAEADVAQRVLASVQGTSALKIHFISPPDAAKKLGAEIIMQPDRLEVLYLALAFKKRPKHNYAVSGECRFWHMRRARNALIGAAVATAAVCSMASALYLSDAWLLKRQSTEIESQLTRLTDTFRRENEQFDPIKADSHEMKLAVDTGDFILANRLPVPWVMQQIGLVMGNYPDVQIVTLEWSTESAAAENPLQQRRGERPMPVPVPAITAISASISADITPFDGNMRKAFARINQLVTELEERTAFSNVTAVEYPLDDRPQSSLSGEIVGESNSEGARFELRLHYPLQELQSAMTGSDDETV